MSDKVIGKCPKCGMSFTAGHSCGFENPFKGVVSVDEFVKKMLTTRNMALEEMAKVAVEKWGIDNCKLVEEMDGEAITWRFEPIQQPQPAPVPTLVKMDLCDTVEAYLKTYSHIESIYVLEEALTAERKRQELVDELIRVAKTHYHKADNLDRAIQALDAFDKERG